MVIKTDGFLLDINNGLKLCWILANIPAGAQNTNIINTYTLPMTYNTYYRCLCGMYEGGSGWAATQLLCYFYNMSVLKITAFNHNFSFGQIKAFCLCIGS